MLLFEILLLVLISSSSILANGDRHPDLALFTQSDLHQLRVAKSVRQSPDG